VSATPAPLPTDCVDVQSCTCPLIVRQSIAQTCPHCQRTVQKAGAKERRHLETLRQQRQLRKFKRQLLRSANVSAR
jgi:hypothetical protein